MRSLATQSDKYTAFERICQWLFLWPTRKSGFLLASFYYTLTNIKPSITIQLNIKTMWLFQ